MESVARARVLGLSWRSVVLMAAAVVMVVSAAEAAEEGQRKHAYAAMMYMGTPRDYEFYVATRVMMRSLAKLGVDADLVVIASVDVPIRWVQTLYAPLSFSSLFRPSSSPLFMSQSLLTHR